jgi:hypothetical protein
MWVTRATSRVSAGDGLWRKRLWLGQFIGVAGDRARESSTAMNIEMYFMLFALEIDPRIERLGELLVGRSLRLIVPAWILDHGAEPFVQGDLIHDLPTRFGSNCVQILDELVEAGMLRYLPRGTVPGRARVIYQMDEENPLWDAFRLLVHYARGHDIGGRVGERRRRARVADSRRGL